MSAPRTISLVVREVARALLPLRDAVTSPMAFATFMGRLGWDLDSLPAPIQDLVPPLGELATAVAAIASDDPELVDVEAAAAATADLVAAIRAIANAPDAAFEPGLVADDFKHHFAPDLLAYLLSSYLRQNHGGVAFALGALGVLQSRYQPPAGNRPAYVRESFEPSAIAEVLADPAVVFRNAFGWGTDRPNFAALFDELDDLFMSVDVHVERETLDVGVGEAVQRAPQFSLTPMTALHLVFFERLRATGVLSGGVKILTVPAEGTSKPGLALMPYFNGILGFGMELGPSMTVTLDADFDAQGGIGIVLRPDEPVDVVVGFLNGSVPQRAEGSVTVRVENGTDDRDPTIVLGTADASRFELVNASSTSGLRVAANRPPDLYSELELQGAKLAIVPSDGDSFLRKLLPAGGIEASFDLAVGVSTERGLYFRGDAALAITKPLAIQIGPLHVDAIHVEVRPTGGAIPIRITADVGATLGPIAVAMGKVGVRLDLSFPDESGNLGVADLSGGFQPPSGLGLRVEAGPVTGGGYLEHDAALGRYMGALELQVFDVGVRALGLLDTRLPGGVPAYSFVAMIAAALPPIPLPFGFTLNEVGGLIAVHRTVDVEQVRRILREGRLDQLLFAENPVADGPRIASDLAAVFPPAADRYVFGPMARIGWGPGPLLDIKVGVLLELPDPVRLILLGTIEGAFPRRDAALIEIKLDVVGELDLGRKRLSLDARLRDSRVASFPIEGEAALRLGWGDEPMFALSVGGFHPDFRPPAGFPALQRVTVPVGLDDNPRLTLKGFLALTSNTFQVGASAEVYASAGWFNIHGSVEFAALFQFSPFSFVADFSGRVTLRKGETDLAGVSLDATVSGPSPWHASGEACLVLKWLPDPCVGFDATFGNERRENVPRIDPWPILRASIENRQSWSSSRVANPHGGAILSAERLDPGTGVTFRQSAVPLRRLLRRFGEAEPLGGAVAFEISTVALDGDDVAWTPAKERFAPAQFEPLSDDEKLARPSFEPMDAGLTVSRDDVARSASLERAVDYETRTVDTAFPGAPPRPYRPDLAIVEAALASGSAAVSPLRSAGTRRYHAAGATPLVTLAEEVFAITSTLDLSVRSDIAARGPKSAVLAALAAHLDAHPEDVAALQVVPAAELVDAA